MKKGDWERQLNAQIPGLRRYARALTQDRALVDDLVQDCLERAWKNRHSWREGSNLRAWLFTIMHHQFVNIIRHNKVSDNYIHSQANSGEKVSRDSPHVLRDLEKCLALIKPEYREVLLLAGLEGLSYREIADVVSAPIGTVMSRLSRGRETLRELMSEQSTNKVVRLK